MCYISGIYIYISLSLSLSLSPSPSPLVRLTSGPEASSAATQQMGKPKGLWIQDHLIVYILEAAIHAQASHASLMHWSVQFFCALNFQVTFAACNLVCRNINCWSLLSVTMSGSVGLDGPGVSRSIPSVFVITLSKPRGPPVLQAFALLGQFDDSYCQNVLAMHSAALPDHWRHLKPQPNMFGELPPLKEQRDRFSMKPSGKPCWELKVWLKMESPRGWSHCCSKSRGTRLLWDVPSPQAAASLPRAVERSQHMKYVSFRISAHAIARKSTHHEIGKWKGLPND